MILPTGVVQITGRSKKLHSHRIIYSLRHPALLVMYIHPLRREPPGDWWLFSYGAELDRLGDMKLAIPKPTKAIAAIVARHHQRNWYNLSISD